MDENEDVTVVDRFISRSRVEYIGGGILPMESESDRGLWFGIGFTRLV